MSKPDHEPHKSKSDIVFVVILAVWMTLLYCERVIKDIMIFYDYNLIESLTKRVEAYFCFIVGSSSIIAAMLIEKSQVEKIFNWLKNTIKSILKPTKQKTIGFIIIGLFCLFKGMVTDRDLFHTYLDFFKIIFDDFKYDFVSLMLFAIVVLLAWLITKALRNEEKDSRSIILKQFILGMPFIFFWWSIYYFVVYGTSLKSHMTDYAYNNGLLKDSIYYTVITALFVVSIYKLKLNFPKMDIDRRWKNIRYFATIALIYAIFSIYLDLKYNEKVIYIVENYEKVQNGILNLIDPLIYQIIREYPEKRDLELVSKHIFRRDFMILVPFIIFIFSWLIWNIYSIPYKNKMKKISLIK